MHHPEDALIELRPLSPAGAVAAARRWLPRGAVRALVDATPDADLAVLGRFDIADRASSSGRWPVVMIEARTPSGLLTLGLTSRGGRWLVLTWPGPAGDGYAGGGERPGSALRGAGGGGGPAQSRTDASHAGAATPSLTTDARKRRA